MPPVITKELVYYQEKVEEMCGGLSMSSSRAKWRLLKKLNKPSPVQASWDDDRLIIIITGKNERVVSQAYVALTASFKRAQRAVYVT